MPTLRRLTICFLLATLCLGNIHSTQAHKPIENPIQAPFSTELAGWETIPLEGATCGTGAPYKYFLNQATRPDQPLIIYLEGGGACVREGESPYASGLQRGHYCMDYGNFGEPQNTLLPYYGLFRRDLADNSLREANYAFIPYCTADLHTGTATAPHDYNPDPIATFNVTHRGHLNILAALGNITTHYPATTTVIFTGSSAGALGALFNFPEVISRWPDTTLVTDAGSMPDIPQSLVREILGQAHPIWTPRSLLPAYCNTDDCLEDTTRLLGAYATHYDGKTAPWHAFGLLQGTQDQTLSGDMEISICAYEWGLRHAVDRQLPGNLRIFTPNTTLHTFLGAPPDISFPGLGLGNYRQAINGVTAMAWMAQLVNARSEIALPASRSDTWPVCAGLFLPNAHRGE